MVYSGAVLFYLRCAHTSFPGIFRANVLLYNTPSYLSIFNVCVLLTNPEMPVLYSHLHGEKAPYDRISEPPSGPTAGASE